MPKNNLVSSYPQPTSRFSAFLIDTIIVGVIAFFVLLLATPLITNLPDYNYILAVGIIFFLSQLVYFTILVSKGQTIGHKFIGIKVEKDNGKLLTTQESLIRTIVFLLINYAPILNILNIFAIFDPKKQNIYDKINDVVFRTADEKVVVGQVLSGCLIGVGCLPLVFSLIMFTSIMTVILGGKSVENLLDSTNNSLNNFLKSQPNYDAESDKETTEPDMDTNESRNPSTRNSNDETNNNEDEDFNFGNFDSVVEKVREEVKQRNNTDNRMNNNQMNNNQINNNTTTNTTQEETEDDGIVLSKTAYIAECMLDVPEVPRTTARNFCECMYNANNNENAEVACFNNILR